MLRGHQTRTFRGIKGRYNRGPDKENIPPAYLLTEKNLMFSDTGIYSRDGSAVYLAPPGSGPSTKWNGKVRRMYEFKRVNEASRLLILDDSYNIYDSSNLDAPILTVAQMVDFSVVVLFNRAYISPHDGVRGLTGEKVYVYTGTGAARPAACSPPSGHTLTAANASASGHIDKGDHLFAVLYLTDTGAYSKMGLATGEFIKWTADGTHGVKISGIPTGPSFVTKVYIVGTRVLTNYNGDPALQQWYFIPNANVTNGTALLDNIDFYDGNLADDASYLLYNLSEIPAGVKLAEYQGRLVEIGEAVADFQVRVSAAGKPEEVSDLDNTLVIDPGDMGGGAKNAVEYRGMLYLTKGQRTYATQDNGQAPNTWAITLVDGNIGAEPLCASTFLDSKTKGTRDQFIVADRTGFFLFSGSYGSEKELSYVIGDDWKRINPLYFHKVQVIVDPINFRIYITAPLDDATDCSHILYCSYHEGLTAGLVKWSIWELPWNPASILLKTDWTTGQPVLLLAAQEGTIYKFNELALDDNGTGIESYADFPFITFSDSGGLSIYSALRARITGHGTCGLKLLSPDNALTDFPPVWSLAELPGIEYTRLINFVAQRLSVRLGVGFTSEAAVGDWFELRSFIISGAEYWPEVPA